MIDYLAAHPEVGIVGPRTLEADGDIAPTARARYSLLRLIAKYWGLDRLSPQLVYGKYLHLVQTAKSPFQADWLQGSCLVMQRAFYAELNGFDEDFFLFMEDADLCERAKAAGKVNVYLPDAQVMHHGSTTVSRFPLIRVRSYHQSPIHYFRKRGQTGAVWVLKWAFTLELLTKIIFRSLRNLIQQDSIVHAKQQAEWTVLRELWGY
jgi:N-acetylglucosaminyl-diphospho-decaprenol L-rhamnosyltransferase